MATPCQCCWVALALTAPASASVVCVPVPPSLPPPSPPPCGPLNQIQVTKAVDGCTRKAADGDAISVHYGTPPPPPLLLWWLHCGPLPLFWNGFCTPFWMGARVDCWVLPAQACCCTQTV